MTQRKRITWLLGAALLWGVGSAGAQSIKNDAETITDENPARGDGAIQPGTLEHATGAGDTDALPGTTAKDQIALSAPVTATAAEIAEHPGQFFGKRVNVTTTVDRSIDPHFFTLESTGTNGRPPDPSAPGMVLPLIGSRSRWGGAGGLGSGASPASMWPVVDAFCTNCMPSDVITESATINGLSLIHI